MPVTKTTRRGNGFGHGGPAKGAGGPGKREGAGRPEGVKDGQGKVSVADLLVALGARQVAADAWMAILKDPTHPHHANMVAKLADRVDGAPQQDVTSNGERIGYVIPAPPEAENATAWMEQYKPR